MMTLTRMKILMSDDRRWRPMIIDTDDRTVCLPRDAEEPNRNCVRDHSVVITTHVPRALADSMKNFSTLLQQQQKFQWKWLAPRVEVNDFRAQAILLSAYIFDSFQLLQMNLALNGWLSSAVSPKTSNPRKTRSCERHNSALQSLLAVESSNFAAVVPVRHSV